MPARAQRRGAAVVLACRNSKRCKEAAAHIRSAVPDADVAVTVGPSLDLGDATSIKQFAKEINSSEDPVHVLVNNAGMMSPAPGTVSFNGTTLASSNSVHCPTQPPFFLPLVALLALLPASLPYDRPHSGVPERVAC